MKREIKITPRCEWLFVSLCWPCVEGEPYPQPKDSWDRRPMQPHNLISNRKMDEWMYPNVKSRQGSMCSDRWHLSVICSGVVRSVRFSYNLAGQQWQCWHSPSLHQWAWPQLTVSWDRKAHGSSRWSLWSINAERHVLSRVSEMPENVLVSPEKSG